jgi:hypothetical protein
VARFIHRAVRLAAAVLEDLFEHPAVRSEIIQLKKALFHPPNPKRAKTRSFPSFVLGSAKSST